MHIKKYNIFFKKIRKNVLILCSNEITKQGSLWEVMAIQFTTENLNPLINIWTQKFLQDLSTSLLSYTSGMLRTPLYCSWFTLLDFHRTTELLQQERISGNHSMQLPARQSYPEPVTQKHIPIGLEGLQVRRLYNLPGQLFLCSATLGITKFFLMLRLIFSCLILWPLLLILPLSTMEKPGTILSALPFDMFKCIGGVPYQMPLLQTEQDQFLQSLLIKEIPSSPLALLATGAPHWVMANVSPTKTPRFFSAVLVKYDKLIISGHPMPEFWCCSC